MKNRRQFLKNTSLAILSIQLVSNFKSNLEKSALQCDPTTMDYYGQGPFYTANPPTLALNQLASANEPGERMIISGRVLNLDCGEFIPDTVVDIWHANNAGEYDNQGYNLRGVVHSNSQGYYHFETVRPGKYLNGSQFRPSHIHFKITPPGFDTLTTQLYFEGDTSIAADAAASITSGQFDASSRIIPLTVNQDGVLEGTWDIIVNGDGLTSVDALHRTKGVIYSISPNPSQREVRIKYGVYNKAKVSLFVHDLAGRQVATLEEQVLPPEKYEAVWTPETNLPKGHYFISLKIDSVQVQYEKFIRQ